MKKLVNILSDKYKSKDMQDLIKDKFSFLKDSLEIQVDSFIAPKQNKMIGVKQELPKPGIPEKLTNESNVNSDLKIVEDINHNKRDQENHIPLFGLEEFSSDETS